jgi:hypothetical protein
MRVSCNISGKKRKGVIGVCSVKTAGRFALIWSASAGASFALVTLLLVLTLLKLQLLVADNTLCCAAAASVQAFRR